MRVVRFEAKHEYCNTLSVCVQRLQITVRQDSDLQFVSIFTRLEYFRMAHSQWFCLLALLRVFVYAYIVYYTFARDRCC